MLFEPLVGAGNENLRGPCQPLSGAEHERVATIVQKTLANRPDVSTYLRWRGKLLQGAVTSIKTIRRLQIAVAAIRNGIAQLSGFWLYTRSTQRPISEAA